MKRFLQFLYMLTLFALIVLFFVAPCFGQTTDTDNATNQYATLPGLLAVIIVALHPLVIQGLKKLVENIQYRYLIALILSATTGVIAALVAGIELSFTNIAIGLPAVFGYGQTAYNTWKVLVQKE